jgi:tetratricopeptide (TPR) repeat protein
MRIGKNKDSEDTGKTAPAPVVGAKPGDYMRAVKAHLRKGDQKAAFDLLQQAILLYPDDPLLLSYYGYLLAKEKRKYRDGVDNCKQAIELLKKKSSYGEETLYPVLNLNLGKAYLAARRKKEALEIFHAGLQYDNGHSVIMKELRALGMRKNAIVPFLDRSNPINKYIGLILSETQKDTKKNK